MNPLLSFTSLEYVQEAYITVEVKCTILGAIFDPQFVPSCS